MRANTFNGISAGITLSTALLFSATAARVSHEIIQAEIVADYAEQKEDIPLAEQIESYADSLRYSRNQYEGVAIILLGLTGLNGALAVTRKHEE